MLFVTCQFSNNRFKIFKEGVDILLFYVGGVFYSTNTNPWEPPSHIPSVSSTIGNLFGNFVEQA